MFQLDTLVLLKVMRRSWKVGKISFLPSEVVRKKAFSSFPRWSVLIKVPHILAYCVDIILPAPCTYHGHKHHFIHPLGVVLIGHVRFLTHRAVEVLNLFLLYDNLKVVFKALFAERTRASGHRDHLNKKCYSHDDIIACLMSNLCTSIFGTYVHRRNIMVLRVSFRHWLKGRQNFGLEE